jgi:DNA polymerase IV
MGTNSQGKASIIHIDMDTFFVSVERLLDQKLEKQPVIVGGSPFGRGVVAGCSREARMFGVHSAMPIRQAYRLCPRAVFLRGNYIHYAEYSRLITEMIADIVPLMEKSSVDEFYLDLSHCERWKGSAFDWGQEIQKMVRGETNLPLSFGLATNKLVAKVATTQVAKKQIETPRYQVEPGNEASFLAPFPIRAMPGIGEATETTLTPFGIYKIGQLAQTPYQLLQRLYGKTGKSLHEKANGIDHSPVITTDEQKSYSRAETFSEDTIDGEQLSTELLRLASKLGSDLRHAKVFAGKITLTLRYSDFTTVTKCISCSYTNQDQEIHRIAEKLFRQLWTRRVRVRLLAIEATSLLEDLAQDYLFTEYNEQGLYRACDGLRATYGKQIVGFASVVT